MHCVLVHDEHAHVRAHACCRRICIVGYVDIQYMYMTNRRELFANKFFARSKPQAYDCLEEWHHDKTLDQYRRDVSLRRTTVWRIGTATRRYISIVMLLSTSQR